MPSTLSHQPNDIPRNILAFRTITTIFAHIQQERPFKFSLNNSKISGAQQRELKISNALRTWPSLSTMSLQLQRYRAQMNLTLLPAVLTLVTKAPRRHPQVVRVHPVFGSLSLAR